MGQPATKKAFQFAYFLFFVDEKIRYSAIQFDTKNIEKREMYSISITGHYLLRLPKEIVYNKYKICQSWGVTDTFTRIFDILLV